MYLWTPANRRPREPRGAPMPSPEQSAMSDSATKPAISAQSAFRQAAPAPAVRVVRYLRSHWIKQLAEQYRALMKIPRVPQRPVVLRNDLDLSAVWAGSRSSWEAVAVRINTAGVGHAFGGVNPGDRHAISALAAYLKPRQVLEVGTHVGSSTLALAGTLAQTGSSITSVDISDVNAPDGPWHDLGL